MSENIVAIGAAVGTFGSAIGSITLIWKLIDKAQKAIKANPNPTFIKQMKEHCENPHLDFLKLAANGLQKSFKNSFGDSFGLRFLRTSAVFSLLTVIIMTLFWSNIRPEQYASFLEGGILSSLAAICLAALFLNLLPDIISLWQTSIIVRSLDKLQNKSSNRSKIAFTVLGLFLLDIILTVLIALLVMFMYSTLHSKTFSELVETAILLKATDEGSFSVGIFFYTTFATTIWVGLWMVASTLQLSERFWVKLIKTFSSIVDSKKDPFAPIFWSIKTLILILVVTACFFNLQNWITIATEGLHGLFNA
jgi:hypothetical protein